MTYVIAMNLDLDLIAIVSRHSPNFPRSKAEFCDRRRTKPGHNWADSGHSPPRSGHSFAPGARFRCLKFDFRLNFGNSLRNLKPWFEDLSSSEHQSSREMWVDKPEIIEWKWTLSKGCLLSHSSFSFLRSSLRTRIWDKCNFLISAAVAAGVLFESKSLRKHFPILENIRIFRSAKYKFYYIKARFSSTKEGIESQKNST